MPAQAPRHSPWMEGRSGKLARFAITVGIGVHLAGFLLFRVVAEPTPAPDAPAIYVSIASKGPDGFGSSDAADLADSEPLFLPTRWNASTSPQRSVAISGQAASPFDPFPAEVVLGPAEAPLPAVTPVLPSSARDALELNRGAIFATFGRDETSQPSQISREPSIMVYDYRTGRSLGSIPPPQAHESPDFPEDWRFAEFQVYVDYSGIVGTPLLLNSSGHESVDRFWSSYLTGNLSSNTLAPGYYRLIAGP